MKRLADAVWVADDFFTSTETSLVIEQAEKVGFAAARLSDSGRRNSEVFLRQEDVRSCLVAGLHRIFAPSAVELPDVFECYRYFSGAAVAAHADAPIRIGD